MGNKASGYWDTKKSWRRGFEGKLSQGTYRQMHEGRLMIFGVHPTERWVSLFRGCYDVGIALLAYFLPLHWKKVVITHASLPCSSFWDFLSSADAVPRAGSLFRSGVVHRREPQSLSPSPVFVTVLWYVVGGFLYTIIFFPS
jgi:hypothetical protein